MIFIQLVKGVSHYYDTYQCGWQNGFTTYAVRDYDNQLVCLYRKNSYPYNIKGGMKT